jgi:hypothetical protein
MSKLDDMLARKVTLITKINGIRLAGSDDYFHVGNNGIRLIYRKGEDAEYDLIRDMFTTATRNAQIELKEIEVKIAAINELLGE